MEGILSSGDSFEEGQKMSVFKRVLMQGSCKENFPRTYECCPREWLLWVWPLKPHVLWKKQENRFQVRYVHSRCFSDSAGGDSYLSCLSDL